MRHHQCTLFIAGLDKPYLSYLKHLSTLLHNCSIDMHVVFGFFKLIFD